MNSGLFVPIGFALQLGLGYYRVIVVRIWVAMSLLLKQFFNICLLQKGPQDLPWSRQLLQIALLVYLIGGVLALTTTLSLEQALPIMFVEIGILLLYPWLCIKAFNQSARYIQMATALAGVGALFKLVSWPLFGYVSSQAATLPAAVSMMLLMIITWKLVVFAHIFRESFNIRLLSAYVLALTYAIISGSVRRLFFPDAGV